MLSKKPLSAILGSTIFLTSLSSVATSAATNDNTSENKSAQIKSESNNPKEEMVNPTAETVKSIMKKGFYFEKKPEEYLSIKEVKLDIFEKNNLDTALNEVLKFVMSNRSSAFMENKSTLNKPIFQNIDICRKILKIQKYIDTTAPGDRKNAKLLKKLKKLLNLMESDDSISEDNPFFRFILAIKDAYATKISRKVASDILESMHDAVESKMSGQVSSKSGQVSGKIPLKPVTIGVSAGIDTNESSSEKSFYQTDTSGIIKICLSGGFENFLSADVNYNLTFTQSLIFYSLEQFLDTYSTDSKISTIEIREPEIKKIMTSRQDMQNKEKSILSQIKTAVEWILKASEIIPQGVTLKIPDITEASPGDKQKSISFKGEVSAAASCLASIGAQVSSERQTIDTSMKHSYLNLIEDDCRFSSYVENSEKIASFLKRENIKKYQEIKNYTESYFKEIVANKTVRTADIMSILSSNLIGDLRRYNAALSVLADKNSTEEQKQSYEKIKKKTEKEWLGSHEKGRLAILKTAIACASYLRDFAQKEEEINLFKPLYHEIEHLSKMQVFAKNSSGKNTYFQTSQKANVKSVTGKLSFTAPILGTTYINACYSDSVSDAYFDTSEDITFQLQIPMFGDTLFGKYSIRNQIKDIMSRFAEKKDSISETFLKTIEIIDNNFDDVLKQLGVKTMVSIPGILSSTKYMTLNYFLTKIPKSEEQSNDIPLPNCNDLLKKPEDDWQLKLIKRVDSTNTNLNLDLYTYASAGASHSIGKTSSIIGSDTLAFITSRYNVFQNGMKDKDTTENYLWNNFKASQSKQFETLFINSCDITKNIRYELQCIWNQAVKNINSEKSMKESEKLSALSECENAFANYLENCNEFLNSKSSENFTKVSDSFDKVMKANYDYNFMPEIKRIYKIK